MKLSISLKMTKEEVATILETKAQFEQDLFVAMGKEVEVPPTLAECIDIKVKSNWTNFKAYMGFTDVVDVQVHISTNEELMNQYCKLFTEVSKLTIPVSIGLVNMMKGMSNPIINNILKNIKDETKPNEVNYKKTKGDEITH